MLAAEAAFGVVNEGLDMNTYWDALRNSWIWEELYKARNYRPVSEAIHCHFFVFPSLHSFFFLAIFAFIFKILT
jgi:electron-transferring-flavoprotein dehydrogenase